MRFGIIALKPDFAEMTDVEDTPKVKIHFRILKSLTAPAFSKCEIETLDVGDESDVLQFSRPVI